ncbi:MAG: CBS domain-containing protein [Elusimicrobia bacterium]|nr:CBS domain-containing protein [Elusimicrobiota bacterium]
MQAKEIMSSNLDVMNVNDTVRDAADMMKKFNIGAIPVMENQRVAGMITDRDITIRCVAERRDPAQMKVREGMTQNAVCCDEDQDLREVARLMEEKQVRRVIVLGPNRKPSGIVSIGDLAVRGDRSLACEALGKVSVAA